MTCPPLEVETGWVREPLARLLVRVKTAGKKKHPQMTRQGGHSLVYLLLITSLGAAEPAAVARVIPVTVTGEIAAAVVKQGQPIRLSVTIANGLKGPIGYTTFGLKPNRWNGETVTLARVDAYRDDKPKALFARAPQVQPPKEITAMVTHRDESGGFLTTNTDLRK